MSWQDEVFEALIALRDQSRRQIRTDPGHAIPHHRADEWLREQFEVALAHKPLTEQEMREECIALETVNLTTRVHATGQGRTTGQIAREAITLATEKADRLGGWLALHEDWTRDPEDHR